MDTRGATGITYRRPEFIGCGGRELGDEYALATRIAVPHALTVDVFARSGLTPWVAHSDELDFTVVIGIEPAIMVKSDRKIALDK